MGGLRLGILGAGVGCAGVLPPCPACDEERDDTLTSTDEGRDWDEGGESVDCWKEEGMVSVELETMVGRGRCS